MEHNFKNCESLCCTPESSLLVFPGSPVAETYASTAESTGSIHGQRTNKIPYAVQCSKKKNSDKTMV